MRIEEIPFRVASALTDPICKAQEHFRMIDVVDDLHPTDTKTNNYVRKFFFLLGAILSAFLAIFTTLPGIALRGAASYFQSEPYLHSPVEIPRKELPDDRVFTVLSWNICGPAGQYSITDGGVLPWSYRIDRVVEKILEKDADVNCLYETMDTSCAFYIRDRLVEKGYECFFNMGPRAIGPGSGILVASKYAIADPEFTAFPVDSLVGRTKNATKGVFGFDLVSHDRSFARIFATHMQHSEECEFPKDEEVAARKMQMQLIVDKVDKVKDRCIVVTGDLNLDDKEFYASDWHARFEKGDEYEERTWGGDEYCARLMGKKISGPLNYDHTMVVKGTAAEIRTSLVRTGYDPRLFKAEALSDHEGLFSEITIPHA